MVLTTGCGGTVDTVAEVDGPGATSTDITLTEVADAMVGTELAEDNNTGATVAEIGIAELGCGGGVLTEAEALGIVDAAEDTIIGTESITIAVFRYCSDAGG